MCTSISPVTAATTVSPPVRVTASHKPVVAPGARPGSRPSGTRGAGTAPVRHLTSGTRRPGLPRPGLAGQHHRLRHIRPRRQDAL
ncbi:hypothetical protein, partial [Actinomadura fibrosa]|uniref:hypothetical protein n=1 Tax=Actinomadura fibrosa TaxID=111802 RepID=UPI001F5EFAD5